MALWLQGRDHARISAREIVQVAGIRRMESGDQVGERSVARTVKSPQMAILANLLRSILRRGRTAGSDEVTITTSMHPAGYEEYGRRFIETFERYWPDNYRLRIYAEGFPWRSTSARTTVIDLLQAVPDLVEFRRRFETNPRARGVMPDGEYNYRLDAIKFANKSFATAHAARNCATRILCWLDADTVTLRAVPPG